MKILTNTQYDAICDIIMDLRKENEALKKEIKDLKLERIRTEGKLRRVDGERTALIRFITTCKTTSVLDFPNSKKNSEDKFI